MDKKVAGLLGAAAALTAMQTGQATAAPATAAANYRDLLDPIPNAIDALKADDARLAAGATERPVQLVQFYYHHHHHHHHHRYLRVVPPPYFRYRYHHHHHHHHHHHQYRGFGVYVR